MREIKFRAWDIESPYMLSWQEIQDDWLDECYHPGILAGDHYIPMQFTGLFDREGVEIYEGDVIEDKSGVRGVIEYGEYEHMYHDGMLGFYLRCGDRIYDAPTASCGSVIGNIYENPKLLESE